MNFSQIDKKYGCGTAHSAVTFSCTELSISLTGSQSILQCCMYYHRFLQSQNWKDSVIYILTCGCTGNSFLFTSLWLCPWHSDHVFTCRNCSMKDSYEIITGICELSDFFITIKCQFLLWFGVLSLEKKARTMESDTWTSAAVQKHLIKLASESFVVAAMYLQFGVSPPFSQSFSLSHKFLSVQNYVFSPIS